MLGCLAQLLNGKPAHKQKEQSAVASFHGRTRLLSTFDLHIHLISRASSGFVAAAAAAAAAAVGCVQKQQQNVCECRCAGPLTGIQPLQ
eukprot:1147183-Pelagomonas_calceolata.AAC.3